MTGPGAGIFGPQLTAASAAAGASAGAFGSALGNIHTAFLSQQGSAFVSAPGDPQPNQPGGGVWTRGVGGEFTSKFRNAGTGAVTSPIAPGALDTNAQVNCAGSVHATFGGLQAGADIARLNVGGWNLHWGTTAGYLSSRATDSGGGSTDFEVPFLGTYVVATHGRFFADVMVRREFYTASLTNTAVGLFGQRVGANGVSVATSAGYNFALANNWFLEPSAGFIWARTEVDPFNVSGGLISQGAVSTATTSPIESQIGRLSLRVGTTIATSNVIWQPFASASVFHEFAGNITSSASTIPNGAFGTVGFCPFCIVIPVTVTGQNSTTRVGTYGQYSLGVAGQLANTGWLGFVRVDYKNGNNLEGWNGNAGIRYQFTPERFASVMPRKAPVKSIAVIGPTNWTGFYVGGFLGIAEGKTDIRFVGDPGNAGNNPRALGALGGFQLGYNYQTANNWVFGVEGDVGAATLRGGKGCGGTNGRDAFGNLVGPGFSPAFLNCENSSNWMATATARVGYSWDRTLFYVKGGGAWADDSVNVSCIFGPLNGNVQPFGTLGPCRNQVGAVTNGFSTSGTRSGWLIGYGTEFDLGKNWSAKAEYDYIDLGSRTALATDGTTTMRDFGVINQVKIGVNYRFSGPTTVVAKY